MDSPNQEDKNERMNRFNLIIMLLILLLLGNWTNLYIITSSLKTIIIE